MPTRRSQLRLQLLAVVVAVAVLPGAVGRIACADEITFERDIRPLLRLHCFQCHGEDGRKEANLDVRLRRLIVLGGDSGSVIEPGKRADSLLFERISKGEMPPAKQLKKPTAAEIELIGRWIDAGAKTARLEPESTEIADYITEEERSFWSFLPVKRPAVPAVKQADRVRTPIDAFVLAKLESNGLTFSPEADKITLLRRACFDLLGLPPSPEQAAEFLNDPAADAYERLIDKLLASPHYGERWGRHWLDVAGYADSEGVVTADPIRKWAYKYRDYVIKSFNDDKPFDQFVVEQLAGDELLTPPFANLSPDGVEKLTATGFLRMAPDGTGSGEVDQNVARNQVVADTIKVVSTSLLGLTVGCAECHNHRYDPIPQTEYYRLRAIFEPALDWKNWRVPGARLVSLWTDEIRKKDADVLAEITKLNDNNQANIGSLVQETFDSEVTKLPAEQQELARTARKTADKERTDEQKKLLKEHPSLNVSNGSVYLYNPKRFNELQKKYKEVRATLDAQRPPEEFVACLTEEPGKASPTHVFFRGDFNQPRAVVEPGELSVLCSPLPPGEGSGVRERGAVTGSTLTPGPSPGGRGEQSATKSTLIPSDDPALPTTGRRLAYARWLTSGQHPLVARVLVNRFWLHHFGRGLVASAGDFGQLGERPTHPELLDWLASEFVGESRDESRWRLKRLHKLIMTSAVYRQSSRRTPDAERLDPDNRLLARMSVRRLEAEAVRDAILTVSGKLNPKHFGPPVPIMLDEDGQAVVGIENLNGENRPDKLIPLNGEEFRRSVYVQVRRSRPLGVMEPFDLPPLEPNCEIRSASTVAPQSLLLMNNEFVVEQAEHFADRVRKDAPSELPTQLRLVWRIAFGVEPSPSELDAAVAFVNQQTEVYKANPPKGTKPESFDPSRQALAALCHALLSSNRFLYVD